MIDIEQIISNAHEDSIRDLQYVKNMDTADGTENIAAVVQAVCMANTRKALILYHRALQAELAKHGIEI